MSPFEVDEQSFFRVVKLYANLRKLQIEDENEQSGIPKLKPGERMERKSDGRIVIHRPATTWV